MCVLCVNCTVLSYISYIAVAFIIAIIVCTPYILAVYSYEYTWCMYIQYSYYNFIT